MRLLCNIHPPMLGPGLMIGGFGPTGGNVVPGTLTPGTLTPGIAGTPGLG
jgi:hypothetical protein